MFIVLYKYIANVSPTAATFFPALCLQHVYIFFKFKTILNQSVLVILLKNDVVLLRIATTSPRLSCHTCTNRVVGLRVVVESVVMMGSRLLRCTWGWGNYLDFGLVLDGKQASSLLIFPKTVPETFRKDLGIQITQLIKRIYLYPTVLEVPREEILPSSSKACSLHKTGCSRAG